MSILFVLIANTLAILATAYLVPGIQADNFLAALLAAVVLGVLNTFLKPILQLLALPVTVLTLGLFSWVISAVILLLTSTFVPGFGVDGFLPALIGSIFIAFFASLLQSLIRK